MIGKFNKNGSLAKLQELFKMKKAPSSVVVLDIDDRWVTLLCASKGIGSGAKAVKFTRYEEFELELPENPKDGLVFGQNEFLPKNQKYSRYEINDNGNFLLKQKIKNHCKRLIFGTVVSFDGRVVPCCFDKDADHEFGNIENQSLHEIRNSKEYINFVKKVFTCRNEISICNNCTE